MFNLTLKFLTYLSIKAINHKFILVKILDYYKSFFDNKCYKKVKEESFIVFKITFSINDYQLFLLN